VLSGRAQVYAQLGVRVTEHGESAYAALVPDVLLELTRSGVAVESQVGRCTAARACGADSGQGALVVPVPGFPAPFLIRKSDGSALYATTDLAAIRQRLHDGHDQLIYVTDKSQSSHFQQVFAVRGVCWGCCRPDVAADCAHVRMGACPCDAAPCVVRHRQRP
jgi:arginyl-tRNA synthetase